MCEISVKPRDASVAGEILHTYRTPVRVFKNKQFAEEVFEEAAEPKLPVSVNFPFFYIIFIYLFAYFSTLP